MSEATKDALVFQLEEYKALRTEIDFYIAEFRLQERNVVIAVGAIWSWLIGGHRDQLTPWLLPIILIVGVIFRSWAMSKHMRTMSGRIKDIEKAFGVVGWESQLVQSKAVGYANSALTWALLVLAVVGLWFRSHLVG